VGITRQIQGPEHGYETNASYIKRRTRDWYDDVAPTTNAEITFVLREGEPPIGLLNPIYVGAVQVTGDDPEPTSSAEAEFEYRDVRGRFKVPGKDTSQMLDTVTFGIGVGGMVGGPVAILKIAEGSLPPNLLLMLCTIYLIVFGGLTGIVIYRRRS
jgi:hypothetical protein